MSWPQFSTEHLIRCAAQRVLRDHKCGRFVDRHRLQWAIDILNRPVPQRPRSTPMSMNVAKWCNTAYDASLRSGRALTPEQAELEFGTPPSGVNVTELLEAMVRDGLMLRETWREENPFSLSRVRTQYRAIEKREIPLPPRPRASYFDGLVRVSSVFELGAAYERID